VARAPLRLTSSNKEYQVPQSATSAVTLQPGTILAKRYRIEEVIGSGGYACVYRATDMDFGYERAIKEVLDNDPGVRKQFRFEAELLINTQIPNIPHGYAIIEDRGRLFLIMEFVRGKDLEELLNDGLVHKGRPLDEASVLRWMIDICGALQELHTLRVPIIHRDIKPANIKITPENRPVLIDFGLAKLQRTGNPTMTAAQGVSPGFAPPEQYMAKGRTDGRTDLYGLGATMYACLTGKDPAEAPARLLAQTGAGHGGAALVPPRRLNPRISDLTDKIIIRALELSPMHRQQSARQMRDELRAALAALEGAQDAGGTSKRRAVNAPDDSDKRPMAARPEAGIEPPSAKQPPVSPAPRAAKSPVIAPDQRGKPAAMAPAQQRGAKQPPQEQRGGLGQYAPPPPAAQMGRPLPLPQAPVNQQTGKQGALLQFPNQMQGNLALDGQRSVAPPKGVAAPQTKVMPALTGMSPVVKAPAGPRPWINLGGDRISAFGKFILTLSIIETLWGGAVLSLGILAIARQGSPVPLLEYGIVWLTIAIIVSLFGGQALSRPIHRQGAWRNLRRGLQGTLFVLITLAAHFVAAWGVVIFNAAPASQSYMIAAFILFGFLILLLGVLSVINILK
jgi:serine/threonine protein kinase